MEKQIINKENYYLTYALTNDKGKIYGIVKDHYLSDWSREGFLYWSEILVYGNQYSIIRKGMLLVHATNEELSERHRQSKINLNE